VVEVQGVLGMYWDETRYGHRARRFCLLIQEVFQSMLKACHISTVHKSSSVRIFHKELTALIKAGYEVDFIVPNDRDERRDGIQIVALPKARSLIHRMVLLTLRSFWLAVRQKADVYHFHDPELIPVGLLLKLLKKKVIYDAHEDVPRQILSKEFIPGYCRSKVSWMCEKIENSAARRIDAVVSATPFIRDRFMRLGCRCVDINNYPILSEFEFTNNGWQRKERAACYIGGINRIRGVFEMVDAIGRTNAKLFLAGEFSSTAEYDSVRLSLNWASIDKLGQVSREKIRETLSRSMVGLVLYHPVPNHFEAQPIKMFEYMSAGIPLVASNFPLWKDIIEGNHCGICVDPLNSAAIARAIQWVVDNPDKAKRMGENGLKAVRKKFNWESEEKKLLSLYRHIGT